MAAVKQLEELVGYAGIHGLPEGLDKQFAAWGTDGGRTLLRHKFLEGLLERFSVPAEAAARLRNALALVEGDERLLTLSRFLTAELCDARWRCDADDFHAMEPGCMDAGRDCYSLLLLLACVEPSLERLRAKGVPEECYADIPYRPMREQFRKLTERGDARVSDFPWDLNFYSCAIFQFDRFLFIPCRMEDPLRVYRGRTDRRTAALYRGGRAFRRDGQLDGAGGRWDEAESFVSVFRETEDAWEGTYLNPAGFAERVPARLPKEEWEPALAEGDRLLAVHVPSGPGYTPERLRNSMLLALRFYDTYFPEIPVKGFWSESWLYDPRLGPALRGQDCNILRTQRQMYLYPIPSDDSMLWMELFHTTPGGERTCETSLQRAAAAYLDAGGYFCTTSMFLLREDAERVGEEPYQTERDRTAFERAVGKGRVF